MGVDIGPKIGIDGEKEFRNQLRQLNQEVKTFGSELKAAAASAEAGADAEEALTKQKAALEKQIVSQNKKLETLKERLAKATKAYGENSVEALALAQKTSDAEAELYKMQSSLKKVTGELDDMQGEAKDAAKAVDDLGDNVKDAGNSVSRGGLAGALDKLKQKLGIGKKDMKDFGDEAKDAAKDVKGFGDEAKGAAKDLGSSGLGGALDELKGLLGGGALGDIVTKGLGIGTVVTGVKELVGGMMDLVTETQEYRKIMASLEVSSQNAGYSAEETKETYLQFYEVLGDQQTAATATANLQALGLGQKELTDVVNAAIGAWSTYGDSIPIDGLMESVNETIKCGQVTGTFADVLNWAADENETFGLKLKENIEFEKLSDKELEKLSDSQRAQYEQTKAQYEATEEYNEALADCTSAEDYFNLALQECTAESERADLVVNYMTESLSKQGEAWRENNEDITSVNRATAEYDDALAELGETLAPVATAFMKFATGTIRAVISAIKEAVTWFKNLGTAANKASGLAADSNYKGSSSYKGTTTNGSHALGLDYVPWDGYTAELHKGEMILTAAEARTLRRQMQRSGGSIESIFRSASGGSSSGTAQTIQIVVQSVLDGKVLGETVTKVQAQMRRAGGMA